MVIVGAYWYCAIVLQVVIYEVEVFLKILKTLKS